MIDSFILLILNKNTQNLSKYRLYLLGWITLIIFPLPAFLCLWYFEDISISDFLLPNQLLNIRTGLGIELGIIYAFFALLILQAPVFEKLPNKIEDMIRNMRLNKLDALFLSLCAGIGEELLFRVGFQHYLGIWITSFLFVAIHGYFNPMNWRKSLYGLIVFPFVLILSYGYSYFGLWFAIGAHFSYDFVLFLAITEKKNND